MAPRFSCAAPPDQFPDQLAEHRDQLPEQPDKLAERPDQLVEPPELGVVAQVFDDWLADHLDNIVV